MEAKVIYNLFTKEEEIISAESNNIAVVVFICMPERCPIVYDVDGIEDVDYAIKSYVRELTSGCNYSYDFVHQIGNVYFFK